MKSTPENKIRIRLLLGDRPFQVSALCLLVSILMLYLTREWVPLRPPGGAEQPAIRLEDPDAGGGPDGIRFRSAIRLEDPDAGGGPDGIRFRWSAVPGAAHFLLDVFDPDLETVIRRDRLEGREYVPESTEVRNLKPDVDYSWWVRALGPDGQCLAASPRGTFRLSGRE